MSSLTTLLIQILIVCGNLKLEPDRSLFRQKVQRQDVIKYVLTGHPTHLVHTAPMTMYKSVILGMDLTFIFMNLTFIYMFIFPGVLLIYIFTTFIFIFNLIQRPILFPRPTPAT